MGKVINFQSDVYIGGDPWCAGAVGSYYDNIQVFNEALTLEQITELDLSNEDVLAGQNKPKSTILFDDSLVLALDFEQE